MNPWPACQQLTLIQKSPFPLCACRCQMQTGFEENKLPHLYFCALMQSPFLSYIILPAKSTFPVQCHSCTSVSLSVNVLPIAQANLNRTGSCLATAVVFTVSFGSLIGVVEEVAQLHTILTDFSCCHTCIVWPHAWFANHHLTTSEDGWTASGFIKASQTKPSRGICY